MNKYAKQSCCCFFNPRTPGGESKVCHLETQPCWTGPGQACWLPREGWPHPSSGEKKKSDRERIRRRAFVAFSAHAGGQQLCARRPEDVGEVLHEIARGLEHPQHLLVSSRNELEPPDRGQALHVVAVDLRAGDFVPRLLPGERF